MSKCLLLFMVVVCLGTVNSFRGLWLGPGRWLVLSIMKCENPEQYILDIEINRRKINRTHDCFDINAYIHHVFNKSYSLKIDVYQEVDGGFKYYQTLSDPSACQFLMRYAKDNIVRGFHQANIEPADCPIQPGQVKLKDFVMDYRELPKHGVYGTFKAIIKFAYRKKAVGCLTITLNFDEADDSDEI